MTYNTEGRPKQIRSMDEWLSRALRKEAKFCKFIFWFWFLGYCFFDFCIFIFFFFLLQLYLHTTEISVPWSQKSCIFLFTGSRQLHNFAQKNWIHRIENSFPWPFTKFQLNIISYKLYLNFSIFLHWLDFKYKTYCPLMNT